MLSHLLMVGADFGSAFISFSGDRVGCLPFGTYKPELIDSVALRVVFSLCEILWWSNLFIEEIILGFMIEMKNRLATLCAFHGSEVTYQRRTI